MGNGTWGIIKTHHIYASELSQIHKEALESYFKTFAQKEFMLLQAEEIQPHPISN